MTQNGLAIAWFLTEARAFEFCAPPAIGDATYPPCRSIPQEQKQQHGD